MNTPHLSEDALKLAQKIAHEIWEPYDDTHGYRNPDNIHFFWGQFDHVNQQKFCNALVTKHSSEPGALELMEFCLAQLARTKQVIQELHEKGIDL